MAEAPSAKVKAGILASLCIVASTTLVQALLGGTPVPENSTFTLKEGELPGYRLQPGLSGQAASAHDRAHGQAQRWNVIPEAGGAPLQLVVIALQSRSHQGFSLEQLTRGPASPAELTIHQPRLVEMQPSGQEALAGTLLNTSKKGTVEAGQTCLVKQPSGQLSAGASQEKLVTLVEAARKGLTPLTQLAELAGTIAPVRWECTLVSVASPAKAARSTGSGGAQSPLPVLSMVVEAIEKTQSRNPQQTLSRQSD
jgi:hypothetical protein